MQNFGFLVQDEPEHQLSIPRTDADKASESGKQEKNEWGSFLSFQQDKMGKPRSATSLLCPQHVAKIWSDRRQLLRAVILQANV